MGRCALVFLFTFFLCGCTLQRSLPANEGLDRVSRPVFGTSTVPSVAVSSNGTNPSVQVFNATYKKIADLPAPYIGALAFDPQGDIYLSVSNQPELLVYSPPYMQVPTTITLRGNGGQVAVDWRTGVFAVVASPSSPHGSSKVMFFTHGSTSPCKIVQWAAGDLATQAAFDADGTFFTTAISGNEMDTVASVTGECSANTIKTYAPAIARGFGVLEFNAKNQLVIQTYLQTNYPGPILTYPHPKNGTLGAAISKTSLTQLGGYHPYLTALTNDAKSLWAANGYTGEFAEYSYPGGGKPRKVFKVSQGTWIDVYPQLVPVSSLRPTIPL